MNRRVSASKFHEVNEVNEANADSPAKEPETRMAEEARQPMSSNLKRKAEDSTMVHPKRTKFSSTNVFRQNLSLPDSLMYYICKNPNTPATYQKLMKACKYFFIKNPIRIVKMLDYAWDKWLVENAPLDLSKLTYKLWITDQFEVQPRANDNLVTAIMPKLYRCDAKELYISYQVLFFYDLPLLFSSAEEIEFLNVTIKNEDGSIVALEKMVEVAVKAKKFQFYSHTVLTNITSKTFAELVKIPHITNLVHFYLENIPQTFDLDAFYNNKTTHYCLKFNDSVSQDYKNRIEAIVDEILKTKVLVYEPPALSIYKLRTRKPLIDDDDDDE
uniref:Uncharacterized protein n=1 Tax=Panagrolaimus davidi TaxID=227884 RepID=A0A914PM09_9BILA